MSTTQAKTATATPQPHDSFVARWIHRAGFSDETDFVLRVVQPALVGMIDGTVSSIAPIFAAAISSSSHTALLVGFSTTAGPIRKGVRKKLDVIDTATHLLTLRVVTTSQSGGYEETEAHRAETVLHTPPGTLPRSTAKSVPEAGALPPSP